MAPSAIFPSAPARSVRPHGPFWARVRRPLALAVALLASSLGGVLEGAAAFPMHDSPMALVLKRGQVEASLVKEKVNDTLDVFDVKQVQTADLAGRRDLDLGAIGDLDGLRAVLNFGLANRTTVRWVGKQQDLEFGRGTAHRMGHELAVRTVVKRGTGGGPTVSLEPVYRSNRGSGLSRIFDQFDAFGLTIIPPTPTTFTFGGVHDETWGLRALATRPWGERLLLSIWAEYGLTRVDTELKTNLPVTQIRDLVDSLAYDSRQTVLGIAGHLSLNARLTGTLELQHYILDRDLNASLPDAVDTNDVVRARLFYAMSPASWVHLEGDYFTNQLGGEIPFLFNKFSASRFDRVYGFVGLGVTFRVDHGQ